MTNDESLMDQWKAEAEAMTTDELLASFTPPSGDAVKRDECACGHGLLLHDGGEQCTASGCPCSWFYEGRPDFVSPVAVEPDVQVIRVHHGNPDAHAESWSDGWNEAHRQGIGGAESREWVIRQVKPILGAAAGTLAPQIADAVLSEAGLSPDPEQDTAVRDEVLRALADRWRTLADRPINVQTFPGVAEAHAATRARRRMADELDAALTARPTATVPKVERPANQLDDHWDGGLRARVEALLEHIAWMADDWAEMGPGDQRNRELWAPLHRKADAVRDLIPGQEPR